MAIRLTTASVNTANTNTDGTGVITDLVTGSTNGTRVDYVSIKAISSTTEGLIRIWLYNGTSWRLLSEIQVPVSTSTPTVAKWSNVYRIPALYVGNSQKLGVTTHNSESFHISAMCCDI